MISIIVPFYNVENYIEECLQSIVSQIFIDFEVILIDDGSTDNSATICERFCKTDARFKYFKKTNEGVSSARNLGLQNASGDFITFVDSDDIIHPNYLETLFKLTKQYNAEIVSVSHTIFSKIADVNICNKNKISVFSPTEAIEKTLYQSDLNNSVWGKIIKKTLFDNILFPQGKIYEDLAVFYLLFERANKIVHTTQTLYFYRQREGSYIQNFIPQRTDVLDITDKISEYYKSNKLLSRAANDRKLSANFNILWLSTINNYNDEKNINRCWGNIKELRFQSLFNTKVRIKNKLGIIVSLFGLRFTIFVAKRCKK